jgi:hypothetical protein
LTIDLAKIETIDAFIQTVEKNYNNAIFDENTKIQIKLKINMDEYIILSNLLQPSLSKLAED